MILEFHFEKKRPDIHVGGVGLFHHLWLLIKLAYYKCMLKLFDNANEHYYE